MSAIPAKVKTRLQNSLKRFQQVISSAKSRDVNESDTVVIVTDMLSEIFGYDKYSEVTSEYSIRSTYCDLAVKIKDKVEILIEAKAIGLELKDSFIKQATDYAANQGIEWVALTNGELWKIYKVTFSKPIGQDLVMDYHILDMNGKNQSDLDMLFLLCKECWIKKGVENYYDQKQALSRFFIGAMLQTEDVLNVIRRDLKKISPNVKIENDQILEVLKQEVLKREVVEGEKAEMAIKKIGRIKQKAGKAKPARIEVGKDSKPTTPLVN